MCYNFGLFSSFSIQLGMAFVVSLSFIYRTIAIEALYINSMACWLLFVPRLYVYRKNVFLSHLNIMK